MKKNVKNIYMRFQIIFEPKLYSALLDTQIHELLLFVLYVTCFMSKDLSILCGIKWMMFIHLGLLCLFEIPHPKIISIWKHIIWYMWEQMIEICFILSNNGIEDKIYINVISSYWSEGDFSIIILWLLI